MADLCGTYCVVFTSEKSVSFSLLIVREPGAGVLERQRQERLTKMLRNLELTVHFPCEGQRANIRSWAVGTSTQAAVQPPETLPLPARFLALLPSSSSFIRFIISLNLMGIFEPLPDIVSAPF